MKKIVVLALVLLMAVMGTVSASKSKFKDQKYDFKNTVNIYLAEAVYTPYEKKEDFKEDSDPAKRALNSLRTAMAKSAKNLVVPPDGPERCRLDLSLVVHRLGTFTYWKEPWTEERYENQKIVRKDKHGKEETVTIPVPRIIHHPGEWISNAYAEVELTLTDRSTGRTVYNCRDDRWRQDKAYDGMLNRIAEDFIKDLK